MFKAAFILVAALAGSGLAAFAVAQESTDEQYMAVGDAPNWYLERSTCTLAHNVNGDSPAVVRFRIAMGIEIEFLDPALRNVRQGHSSQFVVAVDGAAEDSFAMGIAEEGRQGYRLSLASYEILDRISAGRRLEATTGRRTLLRLDLAGAAAAIAALRACDEEGANLTNAMAEEPGNMSAMEMVMTTNSTEARVDALENAATPEEMNRPEPK